MAAEPRAAQNLDQLFDLTETILDPSRRFERRLASALESESDHLDVPCGFLTNIDVDDERQEIVLTSGTLGDLDEGDTLSLSESYCRKTIASPSGTLAVTNAGAAGWDDDPAYQRFGLDTYVGSTVDLGGEPHGTLCFAGDEPREEPFDETAIGFVELLAQWVSYELARRTGREPSEPFEDPLSSFRDGIEPSAIDTALELLCNPTRRELVSYLTTAVGPTTVDDAAAHLANAGSVPGRSPERIEISLVHSHVPKLADADVVAYDEQTREIDYQPTDAVERVFNRVRPLEG